MPLHVFWLSEVCFIPAEETRHMVCDFMNERPCALYAGHADKIGGTKVDVPAWSAIRETTSKTFAIGRDITMASVMDRGAQL